MNLPKQVVSLNKCWRLRRNQKHPFRNAYSLLELLIAMGLLAVLLTVAWSLLATYRDAQQRGWSLNQRTQALRAIRQWLEQDLMQLDQSSAVTKFTGNASGFTTAIRPSIDPLPYIEQLFSAPRGEQETMRLGDADSGLSSQSMEFQFSRNAAGVGLPDSITIQYRLVLIQEKSPTSERMSTAISGPRLAGSTVENWKLVRRELDDVSTMQHQASDSSVESNSSLEFGLEPSERTLTSQDLYRVSGEESTSRQSLLRESTVLGISSPIFAYWDGRQWRSSWDSESAGKLPTAVRLTLNLSRDQVRQPQPEPSAEIESEFNYDSRLEDDREAAEGSLSGDDTPPDADQATQESSDARIVVRLVQATSATSSDSSNSLSSATSALPSMGSSDL